MTALSKIEGIGDVYTEKLTAAGIGSLEALLEKGATPRGRKELADATGIGDALILKWVNRADLFRVRGIGEEYSDLLEKAGVDTAIELAQRNPENLLKKMDEVNTGQNVVRKMPALSQVTAWVEFAANLPRVVLY